MRALAASVLALAVGISLAPERALAKDDLVLAIQGEPEQGYDPILGWGAYGHPLIQSTLLTRDADLAIHPDLATDWRLSDDRLTWTVTIRDDVVFSDGTKLTAEDVAFTFRQAAQSGGATDLSILAQAEARDATTIVFRLKSPRITFLETFITLGIVPSKSYGPDYGRKPIGSGPYRFVRWQRGQQLVVEANPLYYGEKSEFKKLTFLFTGEDTSFAAARAGQLDVVAVPPALAGNVPPTMRRVVARTVDNRGLMFPMRAGREGNDVTADPAIRKAINVALDRRALVETAAGGYATPATGPADGLPWSNPQAALPDADPRAAEQALDAAGWRVGPDGLRARGRLRAQFQLVYFATDSTRQMLALSVADQLRRIGILAEPTGRSADDVRRLMTTNVVLFGWGSHNPMEVYYIHHSSLSGSGYYNAGFYANPAVDAHLDRAQASASLAGSYPEWKAAAFDGTTGYGMRGDAAWAWLVNLDHVYFVDRCLDVGRLQIEPHGHGWPVTAGIANWRWTCP